MTDQSRPGEARNRKRLRNQILFVGFASVIGGFLGFMTGYYDQGEGNLFNGDWEALSLDPTLSIALAVMLTFSLLVLPLIGFRMIDDFQREQNLVAFTAGCLGVLSGFPAWALLYAGGFAPPPHAFGVFAIAFVSMAIGFVIAQFKT
ncbi:MAG: hypothetical protein QNJ15_03990 [Erythrobacter sp.]|nr:hypothetical protein [Erythrobacter sp.]